MGLEMMLGFHCAEAESKGRYKSQCGNVDREDTRSPWVYETTAFKAHTD